MSNYCYDCGREDDDRTWWQQRPSWLRPIRWALRPWRRHVVRPLRGWWYAPEIIAAERHSWESTHCANPYKTVDGSDWSPLHDPQPWEYLDPNPMPAFGFGWWPTLAAPSVPQQTMADTMREANRLMWKQMAEAWSVPRAPIVFRRPEVTT